MTRLLLAIGTSALLLAAPVGTFAVDSAAPAAPAAQAAPQGDGCMPGGGCCGGSPGCPKAPRGEDGKVSGGCPCSKAKEAAKEAAPPANP